MADFSFIRSDKLRSVVERDYSEMQGLSPGEEPKATVLLAGAVLEGLLVDALALSGRWDFDSTCQLRLSDMIGPARTRGIIREDRLPNTVKEFRALIHPGREVRTGIELTREHAEVAKNAVELTIRDISCWYNTQTGKQSDTPRDIPEVLPPRERRTFLAASERSIDVRIEAAVGSALLIYVTNNSDEEFEIAGASVELDGATLGSIARPQPGTQWRARPRGQIVEVRWPDPSYVMVRLVNMVGRYDREYQVSIDFIFDCALDDERREFKKRIRVLVDPVNRRAVQI